MLVEVIRRYNKTIPFQPYTIRTNGGEILTVPHPDFIFVAPKGSWVEIIDDNDAPHFINAILIEEVTPVKPKTGGRQKKIKSS